MSGGDKGIRSMSGGDRGICSMSGGDMSGGDRGICSMSRATGSVVGGAGVCNKISATGSATRYQQQVISNRGLQHGISNWCLQQDISNGCSDERNLKQAKTKRNGLEDGGVSSKETATVVMMRGVYNKSRPNGTGGGRSAAR